MRVDVVTPVYGEGPYAASQVLEQLEEGDRWIVVDNNPVPRAGAWLPEDGRVAYIHEATPGAYSARRAALEYVKADVVAFLDAECAPGPGWLQRGKQWFTKGVNTVAGRVWTTSQGSSLVERYDAATAIPQDLWEHHRRICAGNMWLRRSALDAAGGFDGNRRSGPDRSLPQRLKRQGGYVYDGSLCVTHPARTKWGSLRAKASRVASSTRVQDSWRDPWFRVPRMVLQWAPMHKRLWKRPLPVLDRVLFSVIFMGMRWYWVYCYLKGGGEPSR